MSFEETRSRLLEKYNVNPQDPGGKKESFQSLRESLLTKYSAENVRQRRDKVSSWADRYNQIIDGYSENGTVDRDEIEELIRDYDSIQDYADRNGLPNASRYRNNLWELPYIDRYNKILPYANGMDKYYATWQPEERRKNYRDSYYGDLETLMGELSSNPYGSAKASEIRNNLDQINKQLKSYEDFYGQFDSQEDYDQWRKQQEHHDQMMGLDIDAANAEIQDLQNQIDNYEFDWNDYAQQKQAEEDIRAMQEQIAQKSQQIRQAERYQDSYRMQSVSDPGADNYDPAFPMESAYRKPQAGAEDRELYEYINDRNSFRAKYAQTWDRFGAWANNSDYAPNMQDYSALGLDNGAVDQYAKQGYDRLTEEEVALYNYYYAQSPEMGRQYLETIRENLMYRKALDEYQAMAGNTAQELAFGMEAGVDQFISGARGTVAAVTTDPDYISPTDTQFASSMVREDLASRSGVAQVAYDLITTTSNMAPSILFSSLANIAVPGSGAVAGALTMGSSAGGNAYQQALNDGYDKTSAKAYGLAIGVAETSLQYVLGGISKLGGKVTGNAVSKALAKVENGILRAAGELGGSMLSEGAEEATQEVLDPIFQNILLGADESVDWGQVAYSGLLGALSAGPMEGAAMAVQTGVQNQQIREIYADSARELVLEALEIDPESRLAANLQAKLDSGKDLSGADLGKLARSSDKAMTDQDRQAIRDSVQTRLTDLGETGDVEALSQAIAKEALGESLSQAERRAVAQSRYGNRVRNEMNPENIRQGNYASGWARQIGTRKVRTDSYNPAPTLEGLSRKYGDQAKAMEQTYRIGGGEQDLERFDQAYQWAYDFGKANGKQDYLSKSPAVKYLTPNQRIFAYQAGQAAAGRYPVDVGGKIRYIGNSQAAQTAENNTGGIPYGTEEAGVHLRHGVQRPDGADSGGQVRAVEGTAGGVPQRQAAAEGRSGAGRKAAQADSGRKVSAGDLGLAGGSSRKNLTVVPETEKSPALERARAVAGDNGLELVLFRGGNLETVNEAGKWISVRAYIQGGTMYVRADHRAFTPEQLARHEAGHHLIAQGRVDPRLVYDRLTEVYDDLVEKELPDGTTASKSQYIEWVCQRYAEAYDLTDMSDEEVFEEILCDALADMNGFDDQMLAAQVQPFLLELKETALGQMENGGVQKTGPPVAEDSQTQEKPERKPEPEAKTEPVKEAEPEQKAAQPAENNTEEATGVHLRHGVQRPDGAVQAGESSEASKAVKPVESAPPAQSPVLQGLPDAQKVTQELEYHYNRIYPKLSYFQPAANGQFVLSADGTVDMKGLLDGRLNTINNYRANGFAWLYDLVLNGQVVTDRTDINGFYAIKAVEERPVLTMQGESGVVVVEKRGRLVLEDPLKSRMSKELQKTGPPEGKSDAIRFSKELVNGKSVVWVDNCPLTSKQLKDHKSVAAFIAQHIGDYYTIIESGQKVFIGDDLSDEYTQSKYSKHLLQYDRKTLIAKNKVAGNLGELIEIASNRRWEKAKHTHNKDAKYGMYRYDSTFAFPVIQNGVISSVRAYDVELLIRNASDGKKYLYDILNITENTTTMLNLTKKKVRSGSQATAARGSVSNNSIPQTAGNSNKNSSTNSKSSKGKASRDLPEVDSQGRELSEGQRKFFKDSAVRVDEYGGYGQGGDLLPVFHATWNDAFTEFDRKRLGENTDDNASDELLAATAHIGFWFNTKDLTGSAGSRAEECYLNITNPYIAYSLDDLCNSIMDNTEEGTPTERGTAFAEWLDLNDYDGVQVQDEEFGGVSFAALRPEQIKRVTAKAPTKSRDIRFSRDNPTYVELQRENELLKERLTYWRGQVKRTKMGAVRLADVDTVARNVLEAYQSETDFSSIRTRMKALAEKMRGSGEANLDGFNLDKLSSEDSYEDALWEDLRQEAEAIAGEILQSSKVQTNEAEMDTFQEIKAYLRGAKISLKENKEDVADFGDFRKRNFGRFTITDSGTPMDVVWLELQDQFGKGFFPEEITNPADQILHIENLYSVMAAEYGNPYLLDYRQNVEALANEILDELFSGSVRQTAPTFADRQAQKLFMEQSRRALDKKKAEARLEKTVQKMNEKIQKKDASIAAKDRKIEEMLDRLSEQIRESRNAIRQLQQDKADMRRTYRESRAKGVESRKKTRLKRGIRNRVRDISGILNHGTKERNVKEGLKETAGKALNLAQVLFSDLRTNTVLRGEITSLTDAEAKALEQYRKLLDRLDSLTDRLDKLNRETREDAQRWNDAQPERQRMEAELKQVRKDLEAPKLRTVVEPIAEREKNRLKGKNMVKQALKEMADAYKNLENTTQAALVWAYDEEVHNRMLQLAEDLEGVYAEDLSLQQLQDVYDMFSIVLSTIRNANKTFAAQKGQTISELAQNAARELGAQKQAPKSVHKIRMRADQYSWNNEKPIYAFHRLGSDTMLELYRKVRNGEDVWGVDIREARAFMLKTAEDCGFWNWNMEQRYPFQSTTGMPFQLSLGEIMSLYAYSKRKQAWDHIVKGGFVFNSSEEVVEEKAVGPDGKEIKLKVQKIPSDATAYSVSMDILERIVGTLTKEQREYVDRMQKYLSETMGAKGNEVSMEMYGVKLFQEENYFPLRSSDVYNQRVKEQQEGRTKIKNSGFTKETKPHASSPIVLTAFNSLWADHVNEMANYHAFVLPLEDFYRVYNFKTAAAEETDMAGTVAAIQNAHGIAAKDYIDQLLKDINAGRTHDARESLAQSMIGTYKKVAVVSSASVLLRQFSALPRAWALVNPKYFLPKLHISIRSQWHSNRWEELKKYAPVAIIKEMGYFDTHMGLSTREYLLAKEYKGLKEKMIALIKDGDYRDEVLTRAPAWADECTWIGIWEAVKRETAATRKDLEPGSQEFLKVAGVRFTEVVEMTQVYDSVFSRSGFMRSGSGLVNMATSFMAEPTTTINLAEYAAREAAKGNKKEAVNIFQAITCQIVLDSLLGSIVYAMRDDDEDENLLEKYMENVVGSFLNSINPLTYLPFVRDVWSVIQGYDVERMDMGLFDLLLDAVNTWGKLAMVDTSEMDEAELDDNNKKVRLAAWSVAEALASLRGIPVRNLRRDAVAFLNLFEKENWTASSWDSVWDAMVSGAQSSLPFQGWIRDESKTDRLYWAIVNGDDTYRQRIEDTYRKEDGSQDQQKLDIAIGKGLAENDPRIREAAQLQLDGDILGRQKIIDQIVAEGHFSQDLAFRAMWQVYNKIHKGEPAEYTPKAYDVYSMDDYFTAVTRGDTKAAQAVYDYLVGQMQEEHYLMYEIETSIASKFTTKVQDAYMDGAFDAERAVELMTTYGGKDHAAAETEIKKWDFELEHGFSWSRRERAYLGGELTKEEVRADLVYIEELTEAEADEVIRGWDFKIENGFAYEDKKQQYMDGNLTVDQLASMLQQMEGLSKEEAALEAKDTANAWDFEDNWGFAYSSRKSQYMDKNITRDQLISMVQEFEGLSYEDAVTAADKSIKGWEFEDDHGWNYSERKYRYKNGLITADDLRQAIMEMDGKTYAQADRYVTLYDWETRNPDAVGIDYESIEKYEKYGRPAGVSEETFSQAWKIKDNTVGIDYDGDGESDRGSVAEQVVPQIGKMPLTAEQKTAIALCFWTKKTVNTYKTW